MNREEILAVVLRHVAEAGDELSPSAIDPERAMKDYDLTSLDIVEVVSRSMHAFKVKLPRAELGRLRTINGLVDLLHRSLGLGSAADGTAGP
jgi:acyl carrier protein